MQRGVLARTPAGPLAGDDLALVEDLASPYAPRLPSLKRPSEASRTGQSAQYCLACSSCAGVSANQRSGSRTRHGRSAGREIGSTTGWPRPRLAFSSLATFGCHRRSGTVMPRQTREATASGQGRRGSSRLRGLRPVPGGDARPWPGRYPARRTSRRIQTPEESGPLIDRSSDHHWLSFAVLISPRPNEVRNRDKGGDVVGTAAR
jgi:hypothetical protein